VHISHLSDQFVNDPAAVVKVNQRVMATVIEVDLERKRISLSLKANPLAEKDPKKADAGDRGRDRGRDGERGKGNPAGGAPRGGNGGGKGGPPRPRRASEQEIKDRRALPEPEDWFTLAVKKGKKS
jgi:uncharacterized protein